MTTNRKSIARITEPNPRHYIAIAGLHSYMPNYCEVCTKHDNAVDDLIRLHDLYADDPADYERIRELRDTDSCELNLHEHGNEYAEIMECTCDNPAQHSDTYLDSDDWYAENDPDYELRKLENAIPDDSPFWQKLADEMEARSAYEIIAKNDIKFAAVTLFGWYINTTEAITTVKKEHIGTPVFIRDPFKASLVGTITESTPKSYTVEGLAISTLNNIPEKRIIKRKEEIAFPRIANTDYILFLADAIRRRDKNA